MAGKRDKKEYLVITQTVVMVLITVVFSLDLAAKTIGGTIDPTKNYIDCSKNDPKQKIICDTVTASVNEQLANKKLLLDNNGTLFRKDPLVPEQQISTGHSCSHLAYIKNGSDLTVTLKQGSEFTLDYKTISDPLVFGARLPIHVYADVPVREWWGYKIFGSCNKDAEDNYYLDLTANVDATIGVIVSLEPTIETDVVNNNYIVTIKPDLSLKSSFTVNSNFAIHNQDAAFAAFMNLAQGGFSLITGKISDFLTFSNNYDSDQFITDLGWVVGDIVLGSGLAEDKVNEIIDDLIESRKEEIPGLIETQQTKLRQQLAVALGLDTNGERQFVVPIDTVSFATNDLRAPMNHVPIYNYSNGICVESDIEGADVGLYFSDSSCINRIDFKPQIFAEYFLDTFGVKDISLGNPDRWSDPVQMWNPAIGASININVESIAGNHMPYFKREEYRAVPYEHPIKKKVEEIISPPTGSIFDLLKYIANYGTFESVTLIKWLDTFDTRYCKLEMRVYKKDITATGLKPLLAIHGGSWKDRMFFANLEAEISHYTDAGYAVFTPFYQQTEDSDVSPDCQRGDWQSITADVEAALQWVTQNGARYGVASDQKVNVFGISAGGNLAAWLMVNKPALIEKGMLLYPPVDAADYVKKLTNNAAYASDKSKQALSAYLKLDMTLPASIDLASPAIQLNSFPNFVEVSPEIYPPAYILHGIRDGVVRYEQALRLCAAYNGDKNSMNYLLGGSFAPLTTLDCGTGSKLALIDNVGHGFETCVPGVLCNTDTPSEVDAVNQGLNDARNWLTGNLLISNSVTPASGAYTWEKLNLGTSFYTDRSYAYSDFPVGWEGLDVLRTANDGKYLSGSSEISFDVSSPVNVYILYDNRATVLPDWMSTYTDTGLTVAWDTSSIHNVYSKTFTAGSVILGGNLASPAAGAASNYAVVVQPSVAGTNPASIVSQPTNQTVAEQTNATFSLVASGTAPLHYQWLRDGQAIPNANSASYTSPVLSAADSGASFSCIVSNAYAEVNSNAVTVSVTTASSGSLVSNTITQGSGVYSWEKLNLGTLFFTDRTYAYTDFPVEWTGLDVLRTPNDDKTLTGVNVTSFDVSEPVTVYILYDVRATALPDWMSTYTNTGQTVSWDTSLHEVYSKAYPAGTISLGGNLVAPAAGAGSNYAVVVQPSSLTAPVPTPTSIISNTLTLGTGLYTWKKLNLGTSFFTDRAYVYTDFPVEWTGLDVLLTPNDDKTLTGVNVTSFDVSGPVTVYILYDVRATVLPDWMSTYTNTGLTTSWSTEIHQVFSKSFPAGTVNLGGNLAAPAAGAGSNYTVVVQPN